MRTYTNIYICIAYMCVTHKYNTYVCFCVMCLYIRTMTDGKK